MSPCRITSDRKRYRPLELTGACDFFLDSHCYRQGYRSPLGNYPLAKYPVRTFVAMFGWTLGVDYTLRSRLYWSALRKEGLCVLSDLIAYTALSAFCKC